MMHRLASLCVGLAFLALATSGCAQQDDGVFGPASGLGDGGNAAPALSLKATPARGPGPLEVEFSLGARDRDDDALTWTLDFGDRTAPAAGTELPATPSHTYKAPGAYVARFTVKDDSGESVSTLSIVVLEGVVPEQADPPAPTQGPAPPPQYQPPSGGGGGGGGAPPPPANGTNATGSSTGTGTSPPPGNTTPSPSNSTTATSTSSGPSSSTSSSSSDTGTSSSTGTETFSDPGTSTSESSSPTPDPEPEPTPTGSQSQTSSEPPL